ncbi:MAG: protocatechuate 3,4-dioxygenase alpha subunit [Planctomycetota bacterium]|jgi:protocatechuate 3,4-dioxygenase alpha subunit
MKTPSPYLNESPSQTAGPYVHIGCCPNFSGMSGVYAEDPGSNMISSDTRGERIIIRGCVYDANNLPLTDALLEIWQADAAGFHPGTEGDQSDPEFANWGRCASDLSSGEFVFETIKPGAVAYPDGRLQAPHISVWIVARGINIGLNTRLYFDDESTANENDPVLAMIEARARVATLIASTSSNASSGSNTSSGKPVEYRFDIYLQGPQETVFFDI